VDQPRELKRGQEIAVGCVVRPGRKLFIINFIGLAKKLLSPNANYQEPDIS
jgi:hypothetical protein